MINLCFHGIGAPQRKLETGEARYWITEELYEAALEAVAGRDDVRLSFDDSNTSDIEIGLPGLLRHGLSATFFVIAGRLGQPGSLTVDEVRQLEAHGMRIGSHGMDHVSWRSLDPAEQQREFVDARSRLSALVDGPVDEAALPRGQYERRTLVRLRELGYRHVHTSDRRRSSESSWLQHRFSIRAEDTPASLRRDVLAPRPLLERLTTGAKTAVKRLR